MYSAADLKKGLKIEIDGEPYAITEFEFCKPGKGTALYRCKLKSMITGSTMDRTFRPVDKVGKPDLEERELYYSYQDGDSYVFSDAETYEEVTANADLLGKADRILRDLVKGLFHGQCGGESSDSVRCVLRLRHFDDAFCGADVRQQRRRVHRRGIRSPKRGAHLYPHGKSQA